MKGRDYGIVRMGINFSGDSDCRSGVGFGGIAAASAGIAKVLFFIFLIIFLVLLIMNFVGAAG